MKKLANMMKHLSPKPKMTAKVSDNAMKGSQPKKYDPSHHLGSYLHKAKKKK